jgi:hypothetical protein
MPDFVIRGVTVKQNAMSSYLGQTKLFDKNRFCILERDTTHASYELGRYLMGAGVIHEVVEHYRNVLMLPKDLTVVGALTLENGPVTSGYGSQSDGAMNAEVLEIVREAISSPEAFRQSVFTTDPVDSLAAQLHKTVWDLSSVQDEDSALEASHSQIGAVLDGKVDEWSVYMKSYVSADSFTVRIRMRHGYSIREEEISVTRYAPGDLNGDGKWNNKDVTRLMQYLAGWDVETAVPPDINGDGKLNNKDVTRLMQYLAGWDVEIH